MNEGKQLETPQGSLGLDSEAFCLAYERYSLILRRSKYGSNQLIGLRTTFWHNQPEDSKHETCHEILLLSEMWIKFLQLLLGYMMWS